MSGFAAHWHNWSDVWKKYVSIANLEVKQQSLSVNIVDLHSSGDV